MTNSDCINIDWRSFKRYCNNHTVIKPTSSISFFCTSVKKLAGKVTADTSAWMDEENSKLSIRYTLEHDVIHHDELWKHVACHWASKHIDIYIYIFNLIQEILEFYRTRSRCSNGKHEARKWSNQGLSYLWSVKWRNRWTKSWNWWTWRHWPCRQTTFCVRWDLDDIFSDRLWSLCYFDDVQNIG